MDDFASADVAEHQPDTVATTAMPASVDTLAYPISPEYVKSWTPVRALCELIANALDEDPGAHVGWADGVLTISDDGPGIPEEGLVLGYSTKTDAQIGQFGEGKKLACLVLARSPEVGQLRYDTVGYGFIPAVERRRLLDGLVPSRSAAGTEVLVYHLHRSDRTRGTVITVACPKNLADEAISRFRALSEPGYQPPQGHGTCVLGGQPGRVWIGGVLVTTMPGLLASYDLPLDAKGLQNRDRTVIEAGALRDAVRAILADSEDQQVIDRFAQHVLNGGKLREPEQFFTDIHLPRARAAWRTWAGTHLPTLSFYTTSGNEEAKLDLADKGYTELSAPGLPRDQLWAFMDRLGVEIARTRRTQHYQRARNRTTWVSQRQLTAAERDVLTDTRQLVRRAIGPFALDRVRVYSDSEESPCSDGFYHPGTGDVAVHRAALSSRHRTRRVLLHEAGHRVAHRGGGRWLPIGDYHDRTRGFEQTLDDFAAVLLDYLAAGAALPELPDEPMPAPRAPRLAPADDPAVPAVRRELAHLLLDQLPHALGAGGFTDEKDLVASTGVHPDYWRTLTRPKVAGHRQQRGGRAWDYDKVALLAQAAGLHPPVVWLGYHLCEGPIYGRTRRRIQVPPASVPWTKKMRDATLRACADLQAIGGAYAEQIPALHALIDGRTTALIGDDRWHAPARTLLALERQRLLPDATPT
ncbi:ATP-binding protein [Actinoplanes sp. NPDC049316]|uniref:ATP-binding protein n=1 Tax=Actinoplanes sp. NPDC049316 TaxID=3154727 RepID=UPI0034284852